MGGAVGPLNSDTEGAVGYIGGDTEGAIRSSSDSEETNDVAGLAERPTNLEGPVVPARRKLTISGNFPLNNVKTHVKWAGACRCARRSTAKFSNDERRRRRREYVDVRRRGRDDLSEEGGAT